MELHAIHDALGRQAPVNTVVTGGERAGAFRRGVRLCLSCGRRRALFRYRGVVKADRHHNLCFECFRAEVNRLRAGGPLAWGAAVPPANPRPIPSRLIADRAAALHDLQVRRRRAQMMARHALESPEPLRVAEPLAS